MSVRKVGEEVRGKDWIIMWERLVKMSTLNLQKIRLFISASSINKTHIFTVISNEFVKMELSFHSSFSYRIFSIGARKRNIFLDPILGIRMILLTLQLGLNCIIKATCCSGS